MIANLRDREFKSGDYTLRNFVNLDLSTKLLVLSWRNNEKIRKWMYNTGIISEQDHLSFIENLRNREDCYYWCVYDNEKPIGVVNIIDVDWEKKEAENGYYISPELQDSGEGFSFILNMLLMIYNEMGIKALRGGILKSNRRAYLMAEYFGATFWGEKILDINGEKHLYYTCVTSNESFKENLDKKMKLINFVKFVKQKK